MNLEHKKQEMQQDNAKTKKVFYKRWWFIGIAVIIVIVVVAIIGQSSDNKETSKKLQNIEWSSLELNEFLPKPENPYGEIGTNSSQYLTVSLYNVNKDYITNYKNSCIDMGYVVESNDTKTLYEAFNDEGYNLRLLYFSDDELSIQLKAPEKMSEFKWSTNGLSAMLPIAKSTYGRVWSDTSRSFGVNIGNTTINDFNDYIELCKTNGFIVDYVKEEKFFKAFNNNGYELTLRYLGFNTMQISLKNDKEDENQTATDDKQDITSPTNKESQETNKTDNNGSKHVSYSTNDETTAKNGNTGVYAYRDRGGQYYNYYIIDFDNGYAHFFSEGNYSETCDKIKITSGDLNSTLVITYHDGNDVWNENLYFKYKNQPDHLILEDGNHFKYDFYTTDLEYALKIRDTKRIINY